MAVLRLFVHLALASIWCGSLYYDIHYMPRIGNEFWAAKLVMLTNINFVLYTVYSVFSLGISLFECGKMKKVADFCFFTSVFPIGVVTCFLFWGLYAISPDLVMPEWIRQLIPDWLNHVTHTLPLIHLLLDVILVHHISPSKTVTLLMATLLVAVYFAILFYIRFIDGYWLYPILSILALEHFALSFVVCVFGYFLLSLLASLITRIIHGEDHTLKKSAGKQKTK